VSAVAPIALSIGDPNGIGPEVAVAAARTLAGTAGRTVLVGDRHVIEAVAGGRPLRTFAPGQDPDPGALTVHHVGALTPGDHQPGAQTAEAGAATVAYLRAALELVGGGQASAIVAAPHSESAVNAAGVPSSGYPSLLARLLGIGADELFLMLVGGGLRIVHATLHERLADALERLSPELVWRAATAAAAAMPALGVAAPRIGLLAINPHAGEGGLFGDDDARITEPAARALRDRRLDVTGPTGADVLLTAGNCDAYVAMYHDQGHIPVKLRAGRAATALTVGAGILFASVGHGAAFDIAGRGVADPAATIAAVRLLAEAAEAP
jgi:4-hydroxy-L-threonine phosphate dehydrogenase PdxA